MSTLADDVDRDNDDLGPGISKRSPPVATDFGRRTTRYMIAGREWTRSNRERALEALRAAVVAWTGYFYVTLWTWADRKCNPKGGTSEQPGWGKEFRTTIERYGATLADNHAVLAPKGQLACFTWGRSRHRGSFDVECIERSGIFLDSDDNGGWNQSRELARDIGLGFVAQHRPVRALSHHIEVPVAKPWTPEFDDDGDVYSWKLSVYCPQLGWIMGIFSELGGLRYEPAWDDAGHATAKHAGYDTACDRLLQLNYIYHRRPEDPPGHVPITDYATGGALDVNALLAATKFDVARGALDRPDRQVTQRGYATRPVVASRLVLGMEEIEPRRVSNVELLVRLRRLRNPESQALVNRLLAGEAYAPIGQRDNEMHRAAAIIAALAPNEDPTELAKLLFTKSLQVMAKVPGADPRVEPYLARAAQKIARAQKRLGGGSR